MTVTPTLVVRPLTDADEPAVLTLLQDSLAGGPTGSRSSEFFRWKHVDNVFGPSPGLVAIDDDRVVGIRLFMRWNFHSGGQLVRAVRPVDTATHPDYQGKGIFKRLTLRLVDQTRDETDLIFNTPNDQSLPGYLKMGWQSVGTVPIHIRPVRWVRFLRGFRAAGHGQPPGAATTPAGALPIADLLDDPRLPNLLSASELSPAEPRLHTVRDLAFLKWRYGAAPGLHYVAVTTERGGELRGAAIGRVRSRGPLTELTLSELICPEGDSSSARRVLRAAARLAVDHVATHIAPGTPAARVRRPVGYLQVPSGGMRLVTRTNNSQIVDPTTVSSWRLSLGDLEVF